MMGGSVLVLGLIKDVSQLSVFMSFSFIAGGAGCAVAAIRMHRRSLYLFMAGFFIQIGLFIFLMSLNIISLPIQRMWPVLSIFAGLALIPAGWHRYGRLKTKYIVPAIVFIALGCFLMIFALKVVPVSFSQFMYRWWPLMVVLAGLLLLLMSLSSGAANKDQNR
jgi:hypothetical protein